MTRINKVFNNYFQAQAFLGARESRRLANNTVVYKKHNGAIAIRLYSTDIIEIFQNGLFKLSSGGYKTPTTSRRFRQYSPFFIRSYKGEWRISLKEGIVYKFKDNMIVTEELVVEGGELCLSKIHLR
jgi:hypothetical protein